MGSIFSKCKQCIVYLGDKLDGSTPSLSEPPPVLHFDPKRYSPVKEKNASRKSGACEAFRFFVELNEDHEQCVGLFEKLCKSCRQISRRSFMAASTRSLVSIASAFDSKIPLPMPTLEACWIS
ncbi:hypothetical protein CC77DRAFT_800133 [Alternaria alternata]|jgi:hypothetical protein|uniref:Uncharacterized protein n=1 Tax=Alternaria alternata TaxID=5599 RepID=A0A177DPL4_ALTAL|nr:hypothetical protein CC77DRAFT_800133 [Alternaria alternata]OAG21407.1 hypothetical protein CC77DRAFT_800133 [Alternaria alternata]